MASIFSIAEDYKRVEGPIRNSIASEFFIQMVNATFMNILPLYMSREGFLDSEIALFITLRFIGVFVLAIPLGKFIKGKKVGKLFFLSNLFVPLFGLAIVISIGLKIKMLTVISLILWGASFTFMQVPILPYILRNCKKENLTAAISLSYSTWSFGGIISGVVIALLDMINPNLFNERMILIIFSVAGFGGMYYLRRNNTFTEAVDASARQGTVVAGTDWPTVIKALIPTLIIATGAGLTIPFISLFFEKVHQVHKGGFSVLSSVASFLVAYLALLVPRVKEKIGYNIAIPTTQSLAVISLVALATTQLYNQYSIAVGIASVCYLLRQPLMNMAGPMTSEVVLGYVGKRNREITSALTSAIWSSSWVISGFMVTVFLSYQVSFANIFLITSVLYTFGVIMYYLLILDYTKKEEQGLIES